MQPGLIWGCIHDGEATKLTDECEGDTEGFRWVHLNLSDQRSHSWLTRTAKLPPSVLELMLDRDDVHQRTAVDKGAVGIVLQDFERDFDTHQTNKLGSLHCALTPTHLYTGRYHPVHTADVIRQRIRAGESVPGPTEAFDMLLDALTDTISAVMLDLNVHLVAAEDDFLINNEPPDMKELAGLRRRAARLHRMVGGMRAMMHRLEHDHGLPRDLKPIVAHHNQRLSALDGDVGAALNQLRLLRDELDLQATQQTNRNLYLLSIMSALMLPATLVTGFFGMNTGGLPLAHDWAGTVFATVVALGASAATYLMLKLLGLVQR